MTALFGSRLFQFALDIGETVKRMPLIGNKLTPLPERLLGLILRIGKPRVTLAAKQSGFALNLY
ncbi:MAG: hypothetical protein ACR2P1_21235 [Pseudomonadales bacterium]